MLNNLDLYRDCGTRCAIARNQKDESRALFESQHMRSMAALERGDDKAAARAAFDDAYKAARGNRLWNT